MNLSLTDRTAVLFAHDEELELKRRGLPHSEAVITLCEWWLNQPVTEQQFLTRSQVPND